VEPSVKSSNDLSVVSSDTSGDTTGDRSINSSKDLTPPIGNGGVNGGVKYILIVIQFKIHAVTAFCCLEYLTRQVALQKSLLLRRFVSSAPQKRQFPVVTLTS